MSFFSIFKTHRPRQFEYIPRYYDPQKEAREERIRQIEAEIAAGKSASADGMPRTTLRKGFLSEARSMRKKHDRSSAFRFLVILVLLLFILYWLVYS